MRRYIILIVIVILLILTYCKFSTYLYREQFSVNNLKKQLYGLYVKQVIFDDKHYTEIDVTSGANIGKKIGHLDYDNKVDVFEVKDKAKEIAIEIQDAYIIFDYQVYDRQ